MPSVKWYAKVIIDGSGVAMEEIVSQLAFNVEGRAKVGASVDTGFMRNSGYTITPQGQRGAPLPSGKYMSKSTGQAVQRDRAPLVPRVEKDTAAVHFAANYTIHQETRLKFLSRALAATKGDLPAVARAAGQKAGF